MDSQGQEVARRELSYRIVRRPPAAPSATPLPGLYYGPVSVVLAAEQGVSIYYSVGPDITRSGQPWKGAPIAIGEANHLQTFIVQAYAQDAAGNRSSISTFSYQIDARETELAIASPVEGTFANQQCLSVSFRGVQWVRYTTDGSDPATAGAPYTGLVLIGRPGRNQVRVAAQPLAPGLAPVEKEVTFTYAPQDGSAIRVNVQSGSYEAGVTAKIVSSPPGSLYYTLSERTPGQTDPQLTDPVSLPALSFATRPATLRIRSLGTDGSWGAEYRYFYVIGKSRVTPPTVIVRGAEPLMGPAIVQIVGPEDALIRYTLDGSAPGPGSALARGPIAITPAVGTGGMLVRAQALDGSGALSPIAERRIAVYTGQEKAPVIQAAVDPKAGAAVLSAAGETRLLVFELTSDGSDPPAPTDRSPRLVLPLSLTVPFGAQRTFKLRSAVVDASGRVLASSAVVSAAVDRAPPPRPDLSPSPGGDPAVAPVSLIIRSAGLIAYSLTSDGSMPKDPGAGGGASSVTVSLPGVDGALTLYRLKVLTVDAAGNASEVYGPFSYALDLRVPRLPAISGITDGGRYGQSPISPAVDPSPWKVVYTVTTDGSPPRDPDAGSAVLISDTTFIGDPGNERAFRVKLLAVSQNGQRKGESREIRFVIDLKPPEVPELTGVVNGTSYARPVTISARPAADSMRLYYTVSNTTDDPADPLKAGLPFPGTLDFDAPDGVSRSFTLRVTAVDAVGNRSLYDRRCSFTIDREPPDDPSVTIAPNVSITNAPVTVAMGAAVGVIRYELTDDGSEPAPPSDRSTAYVGPMLLVGKTGGVVTYHLLARAFDPLGNASPARSVATFTIDRTVPAPPAQPQIRYVPGSPGTAYLTWAAPTVGRLLVRLKSPVGVRPSYAVYDGPVALSVPDGQGVAVSGDAVIENEAGTRSQPVPFSQTLGSRPSPPEARGARDGGIYAGAVDLRLDRPGMEVRYEVSTDGSFPPTVLPSSPLLSGALHLDAADGETIDVRLAARAFDPTGSAAPSEELRMDFQIDRTPPDPPTVAGIQNDGYYQDQRIVTILSNESDIYYTVVEGPGVAVPTTTEADRYRGPVTLDVQPARVVSYTIAAYCVDAAGNRSRSVSVWAVTIDNQNIFVSPLGNDFADGSRGSPFRTLSRAVEAVGPRSRILLAAGEYALDTPLLMDRDVSIVGGLDAQGWQPANPGRISSVSVGSRWTSWLSPVSITGGSVSMRQVELRDVSRQVPALLSISGGVVRLEQVTVSLSGLASIIGIDMGGGSLTVVDSQLQAAATARGTLLSADGGNLDVSDTRFIGPSDAADFACMELSGIRSARLKDSSLEPGTGQRTRAIRADRSQIRIEGGKLGSGAGSVEAITVDASASDLSIEGSEISARGRSPIGILSSDSSLLVSRSKLSIAGSASAVGIGARGGQLGLVRSTLQAADAREYLVLARFEECTALVADNLMLGAGADQSFVLQTRGGAVDILNNTVIAGTGGSITAGVLIQGDRAPRILNNILVRSGEPKGTAILSIGAATLLAASPSGEIPPGVVILTNSFSGWERLLRVEYSASSGRPALQAEGPGSLNALDGDPEGGTVRGNRVESPARTFRGAGTGDYHLAPDSASVNAASDPAGIPGLADSGPMAAIRGLSWIPDLDGRPRPAQQSAATVGPPRGWDIGAYELGP